MYTRLFKKAELVALHSSAPLLPEREQFLLSMESLGCKKSTLTRIARVLLFAVRNFSEQPLQITSEQLRTAAKGFRCNSSCNETRFVSILTRWYRFLGCMQEPVPNRPAFAGMIDDFSNWLKQERGLSLKSIQTYGWHINEFLRWYWPSKSSISSVRLEDIDAYLGSKRTLWSRKTMCSSAASLRGFFRHAVKRGWCIANIADGIESPPSYSHENIPLGPEWDDVSRLLAALESDKVRDIRDRVIIMLCAIYGFRSSEVTQLKIEDIDWERNCIMIWRPKQLRKQIYPLLPVLGNALIKYLREARPKSIQRELFLTLRAPFRPISTGVLRHAISTRLKKWNIHSPRRGPHGLRHACATHLVQQGFSLKEIGDHLGNRSSSATMVYAKVDLPSLRKVAILPYGGGL
ncbi:MAG: site-specific integrase [Candidatus Obscuribacterales bacterium]|nr:site-specific integrase [Candidatus Obscuribacterales bacterium]